MTKKVESVWIHAICLPLGGLSLSVAFWTHKPTPALHFLQNASPPWSATTLPKFCSWDVELRRVVGLTNSWLNDHEVLHNLLGVM